MLWRWRWLSQFDLPSQDQVGTSCLIVIEPDADGTSGSVIQDEGVRSDFPALGAGGIIVSCRAAGWVFGV
jgi:hypothetical protein